MLEKLTLLNKNKKIPVSERRKVVNDWLDAHKDDIKEDEGTRYKQCVEFYKGNTNYEKFKGNENTDSATATAYWTTRILNSKDSKGLNDFYAVITRNTFKAAVNNFFTAPAGVAERESVIADLKNPKFLRAVVTALIERLQLELKGNEDNALSHMFVFNPDGLCAWRSGAL